MTNKRRHKRVTIKSVGDIFCVDDNRRFTAYIGGISRGGLEIYAPERVKPKCRLEIQLTFLDKDGKETVAGLTGEVRWSAPFRGAFIAGIQFDVIVDGTVSPELDQYLTTAEEYF